VPDTSEKPKAPSKWAAFALRDSKALEAAFQRMMSNPLEKVDHVPVNEDHLFEVDIGSRELKPVYFRASTYEVRTVFFICMGTDSCRFDEGYGFFRRALY
jgi:hypothetical protein